MNKGVDIGSEYEAKPGMDMQPLWSSRTCAGFTRLGKSGEMVFQVRTGAK